MHDSIGNSGNKQKDILTDLKKQREVGMSPREIIERFKLLTKKGQELDQMTVADSDKDHKPELPKEKSEKEREREESIARYVDQLIVRIEDTIRRDNFVPKGVDKYRH